MSINRVNISGNLTRDPELRTTTGGTGVLTFGVAVNDRRKNPQTGEYEDVPNFVDCAVFGARAEPLSRFLSKGSKVAIEGKLRYSSWETQDGGKRSKLEVVVDEIEFMSPRSDQQQAPRQAPQYAAPQQPYQQQYAAPQAPQYAAPQQQYQQPYQQQYAAPQQQYAAPQAEVFDEDIPF